MLIAILYFNMAAEILQMWVLAKTEAYLFIVFKNVPVKHDFIQKI